MQALGSPCFRFFFCITFCPLNDYVVTSKLIENLSLLQKTGFYESGRCNGADCDLLMIATSACFGSLGVSFRPFLPVVLVNTPSPNFWAVDPMWDIQVPGFVGNVFVHEVGHYMGLDHACTDCFPDACDACAYPDDVMSYCRSRWGVNLFEFCSLDFIENHYVPNHPDGTMYWRRQAQACNDPLE